MLAGIAARKALGRLQLFRRHGGHFVFIVLGHGSPSLLFVLLVAGDGMSDYSGYLGHGL